MIVENVASTRASSTHAREVGINFNIRTKGWKFHFVMASMGPHCPMRGHGIQLDSGGVDIPMHHRFGSIAKTFP